MEATKTRLRWVSLVLAGLADEARAQARCSRARIYQYVEAVRREVGSRTVDEIRHRARKQVARSIYQQLLRLYAPSGGPAGKRSKASAQDPGDPVEDLAEVAG